MSMTMSFPTGQEVASSSSLESPQPCRRFTISEILVATKNFDESLVVGRGGSGKVYRGIIMQRASILDVAIKRLTSTSNQAAIEFQAEVKMLSKLRHCHLVSLIGYCSDEQKMILVYEYMPHGTLEDHLHKRGTSLHWLRRLKICIGAARGLDYLHTGTGIEHGIIHRDVKSSNILLNNSWAAKVSDFGLSKICLINKSSIGNTTVVKGTFGYLDPHYVSTGKPTLKTDVYAFGVVLLEVLCGKQALDSSLEWGLAGWAQDSIKEGKLKQIVDDTLDGRISAKCLKEFTRLADQCLHSHPNQRPTMAEVVVCLESILATQEKAKTKLGRVGMTIFGTKTPSFLYPSNGEHSGSASVNDYGGEGENLMFRRFDFHTLNAATENFSEANISGLRELGLMYKGRLQNGQEIAIVATSGIGDARRRMVEEWPLLLKLEHENLLSVLGYCHYETKVFFVYKFAPYASLHELLSGTMFPLLDWDKRYIILLGVARVLLYLHNHAPIRVIHGDLKPRSILLDENLDPKLSNFLIAKRVAIDKCSYSEFCRRLDEYVPLEYLTYWRLTEKTDVFCFGVVAFETIIGITSSQFGEKTGEFLREYAMTSWLQGTSIRTNPRIGGDSSLIPRMVEIGLLCIQPNPADRPTMEEVVHMLLGGSSPTSRLSEIRERVLLERSNGFNVSSHHVDIVAIEKSISDLFMR